MDKSYIEQCIDNTKRGNTLPDYEIGKTKRFAGVGTLMVSVNDRDAVLCLTRDGAVSHAMRAGPDKDVVEVIKNKFPDVRSVHVGFKGNKFGTVYTTTGNWFPV